MRGESFVNRGPRPYYMWATELQLIRRAVKEFPRAVGEILRQTRGASGLTLRDVELRSHGYFKPSVLGGYERGERGISLERFCRLAEIYDVPADRMLARVFDLLAPEGRNAVVIDLDRLSRMSGEDVDLVARYIYNIKQRRRDPATELITLRSGDLQALALSARLGPRTLLTKLRAAMDPPASS